MPWTGDQVYTLPKPEVIDFLKQIPYFNYRLFWVKDLDGIRSKWTKSMMNSDDDSRHSLPEEGLLVIGPGIYIPVGEDEGTDKFWLEYTDDGSEKWSALDVKYPEVDGLPASLSVTQSQLNLFGLLQMLSKKTNTPFFYYKCEMWGGDIDEEYSVVFNNGLTTYFSEIDFGNAENSRTLQFIDGVMNEVGSTPLQLGLGSVGLELPTWFFALHAGFDFKRYRIR